VAEGVHRMALPLGIHGVPTVSAYLIRGDRTADRGDTLVDCGIAGGGRGGELWLPRRTERDLAKYSEPDDAIDRRMLMLADHGLYGPELTESSEGLRDWLPVMPSIGRPSRLLDGGERFAAGDRSWEVVHTPGHSPGHVCLWNAEERLLCSGDHLLQVGSPPVTFEGGFEPDPLGFSLE